ncbi:MAG: hypothetical protein KatS3mg002_1579 [Candidatus Woesearchaeota archaeon]|nr:MAG: hypothetical protein KatS3mg002_1579 [Candidatus Woesearchaeota archaeon]
MILFFCCQLYGQQEERLDIKKMNIIETITNDIKKNGYMLSIIKEMKKMRNEKYDSIQIITNENEARYEYGMYSLYMNDKWYYIDEKMFNTIIEKIK